MVIFDQFYPNLAKKRNFYGVHGGHRITPLHSRVFKPPITDGLFILVVLNILIRDLIPSFLGMPPWISHDLSFLTFAHFCHFLGKRLCF